MDKNTEKLKKLDNAIENEKALQEQELLIDFDAAIKEKEEKPFNVKFMDSIYKIPSQMPFSFSMFFFRNCYKKYKGKEIIDVPEDKIDEFIELLLGKEFLKKAEKSNVSLMFIMDTVASKIMNKWGYDIKSNTNQKKI